MEEVCQGKDEAMAGKEQEIATKQRAPSEVESLTGECAAPKGKLEGNTEQIRSLQADIQKKQVTCNTD